MKNFIILFLLFQYSALFGQVKFEYEIAVNSTEVPVKCTDFIGQLNFASDVRWIKERSQLGTSYEAKFSFEKTIYQNHYF